MKLLVDNNLSPKLARGLAALFDGEHDVIHIREKFGTGGLPDEEWIEHLGREGGWCVLSGDRRIATRKPSRDLFLRSNLIGFFLLPAVLDLPVHRQAGRLLALWSVFEAVSKTTSRACYDVGIKGDRLRQTS